MAHPLQQRKLLVTVCKAEIGWEQETPLASGYVQLVVGPFRASTRSVPAVRRAPHTSTSGASQQQPGLPVTPLAGSGPGPTPATPATACTLSWPPSLGAEMFLLSEDALLISDLVIGAELWGRRGKWTSDVMHAQAEITLDAGGQALLLSGRCLHVRLPLLQPVPAAKGAGQGGRGPGGRGGGGGGGGVGQSSSGAAAGAAAGAAGGGGVVVGMLALSMLLQPADAEAAVCRSLPVELLPRALLDATPLLPGAVLRSGPGTLYVDPCVVFIRIKLMSVTGLGTRDPPGGGGPGGAATPRGAAGRHSGRWESGGAGPGGQPHPVAVMQAMGARLQAHADKAMGHVGAFITRLKEAKAAKAQQQQQQQQGQTQMQQKQGKGGGEGVKAAPGAEQQQGAAGMQRQASVGSFASGGGASGKGGPWDHAAAETVMSLLESNGFAVVDNRRLSNYFWCKVSYEGQYHTSRLVPVVGGTVRWDETFVVAALRPIHPAPIELELYGSNDSKSRGKVVCSLSIPLCDVILDNTHGNGVGGSTVPPGSAPTPDFQRLPNYHPNTWPRGRVALTAIGQAGQAGSGTAVVTHGSAAAAASVPAAAAAAAVAASSAGGGGGGGGANQQQQQQQPRGCTFHLEYEVVDADTRAAATGTQLLPWAQHHHLLLQQQAAGDVASAPTIASPVAGGGGGGGGDGSVAGGSSSSSVSATRQGSLGVSSATGLPAGEALGDGLSMPLSPTTGTGTATAEGGGGGAVTSLGMGALIEATPCSTPRPLPHLRVPSHAHTHTQTQTPADGTPRTSLTPAPPAAATAAATAGDDDDEPPGSPVGWDDAEEGAGGGGGGAATATVSEADGDVDGGSDGYDSGTFWEQSAPLRGFGSSPPSASGPLSSGQLPHLHAHPHAPQHYTPARGLHQQHQQQPSLLGGGRHVPRVWGPSEAAAADTRASFSSTRSPLLDAGGGGAPSLSRTSYGPAMTPMSSGAPAAVLPPAGGSGSGGGGLAGPTVAAAPGTCSASQLAAYSTASLTFVVHDIELDSGGGQGGGEGGGGDKGQEGKGGGDKGQDKADYFIAVRCGACWASSCSLTTTPGEAGGGGGGAQGGAAGGGGGGGGTGGVGAGGGGGGARLAPHLGVVLPLLRPSAVLSLALYRRTDTVAGKKVLNVRAMIGILAAEQLVGRLRVRASSLVPGSPVTVTLPLKADRSGPRPCATVGLLRATLLLSPGPGGLVALLGAYAVQPLHLPVAMLQAGAVAGPGLSATLPVLDPRKKVDADTLQRRERRLLIKWVSEGAPAISANTARRLLEDGRTEFNPGRTNQNWRRIFKAFAGLQPLGRFWARVQSWEQPGLTLAVACGEVALLLWPSRVVALALAALIVHLLRLRGQLLPCSHVPGRGHVCMHVPFGGVFLSSTGSVGGGAGTGGSPRGGVVGGGTEREGDAVEGDASGVAGEAGAAAGAAGGGMVWSLTEGLSQGWARWRCASRHPLWSRRGLRARAAAAGVVAVEGAAALVCAIASGGVAGGAGRGAGGRQPGGEGEGGDRTGGEAVGAEAGAGGGPGRLLGVPPPMVDDIAADNEEAAEAAQSGAAAAAASTSATTTTTASLSSIDTDAPLESSSAPPAPPAASPSSHPLSRPSHLHTSSAPIPTPTPTPPLHSAAAAAASWVFGSPPQSSPASSSSIPIPNAAAMGSPGGPGAPTPTSGLPLPPPAASAPSSSLPPGVSPEWAAGQQTLLVRGGEVPKDPLAALKQQYDSLVGFMLRVQNVLDDFAGAMERWQALLTWRDPSATALFVAGLALGAVFLWCLGLRVAIGALLLYDLRPPRLRDPWLPPPANMFGHLPTRADLMT